MLSAVKEALTKEIDVKGLLTKEIHIKEFLEMEVELTSLKELLATEIKLKEFLVQEIDLTSFFSEKSTVESNSALAQEQPTAEVTDKHSPKSKKNLPAYDYGLIESLSDEHKKIRFIFNRIMSYAIEKKYDTVATQLDIFNREIREHYQKADIELYSYLKTFVQIKYPKREKAFTQLSLEMKNISIEIFYIISQSPNVPLSDKTYDGFMKEFMALGKLLNERVNRENTLMFKMYTQTKEAKSIS